MFHPSLLVCYLLAVAVVALGKPSSPKAVDLAYAKYQSDVSLEEGVTSFLGIRYAAAPAGTL
jgi:hypothetical protein